jgi:amino acid transporter
LSEAQSTPLPRRLGLATATATVAGLLIGSGIFRVPAEVAAHTGTPAAMLLVWVVGGLLALCLAFAYAELGTLFPRNGGSYVFIREAWGRGPAFVFGWTFLLINPSAWAALALVFAEYAGQFVPMTDFERRALAVTLILALAAANYTSVRLGAAIQNLATFSKAVALTALALIVIGLHDREAGALANELAWQPTPPGGFLLALVAVLWAYDGAAGACAVAGEVREPHRALPLALLAGVGGVMAIYLVVNVAYLWVLPFEQVSRSPLVAADVMQLVLGPAGGAVVAALVMVSTFGALAAATMTDPRVFFAMARDGNFFERVGATHPRHETPHVAVALAAVLACVYVSIHSFEALAATFVLGILPFYALAVAGVIRLRRSRPDLPRPYRAPGYPFTPLLYIVGVATVFLNALVEAPWITLVNIGVSLAGIPAYFAWRRLRA